MAACLQVEHVWKTNKEGTYKRGRKKTATLSFSDFPIVRWVCIKGVSMKNNNEIKKS